MASPKPKADCVPHLRILDGERKQHLLHRRNDST
jgi:hypothetical protein